MEKEAESGESDGDTCNYMVDSAKVAREREAEEEESELEHEGQEFRDKIEVPGGHSYNLAMSVPTTINERPVRLDLRVAVKPLLAEHGSECNEEGNGKTREKDGLDVDNGGIRASPPSGGDTEAGCFLEC